VCRCCRQYRCGMRSSAAGGWPPRQWESRAQRPPASPAKEPPRPSLKGSLLPPPDLAVALEAATGEGLFSHNARIHFRPTQLTVAIIMAVRAFADAPYSETSATAPQEFCRRLRYPLRGLHRLRCAPNRRSHCRLDPRPVHPTDLFSQVPECGHRQPLRIAYF